MNLENATLETIIPQEDIERRISELAEQLNREYEGEEVVLVCVLKGAFMFFSDLAKQLTFKPEIDFVRLASYGKGTKSSGNVRFTHDMECDVDNKHVLIIEDIVDSGLSMEFLLKVLAEREAKSVKICSLVDKHERREIDLKVDFPGFTLEKGFVVGYGMDYAERFRELPAIYDLIF